MFDLIVFIVAVGVILWAFRKSVNSMDEKNHRIEGRDK
jgi:hypothetical protein